MIIDADAHFTPKLHGDHEWILSYNQRKKNAFSDINLREEELIMLGVDKQLLNPMGKSLELFYSMPVRYAGHIMRTYNEAMYDIVADSARFNFNLWLALQDIEACLAELDRYQDKKFFGVHVSEAPAYGFLSDMNFLWSILNDRRIPWYMHLTVAEDSLPTKITVPPKYEHIQEFFKDDPWKFSIASLILNGIPERYPNIPFIIAERDIDWIKSFCWDMLRLSKIDPLPIFRKHFWFTIEPENKNFLKDADYIGFDRLLFATDWPHDHDAGGKNSRQDTKTIVQLGINVDNLEAVCYKNYQQLENRSGVV